eukprot:3495114-Pleurochrysis_carterae.AAC.1
MQRRSGCRLPLLKGRGCPSLLRPTASSALISCMTTLSFSTSTTVSSRPTSNPSASSTRIMSARTAAHHSSSAHSTLPGSASRRSSTVSAWTG